MLYTIIDSTYGNQKKQKKCTHQLDEGHVAGQETSRDAGKNEGWVAARGTTQEDGWLE